MNFLGKFLARRRRQKRAMRWLPQVDYLVMLNSGDISLLTTL